jgi:L-cystine uptake protein TcyP (sodium:dicarboxylate symporter family)
MWEKIIILIFFTSIITSLFLMIQNKSNFPKKIIIPILVALITKYSLGDLDKGYQYSMSDIFYWFLILFIPYVIVIYFE